jgi:hypothetical protein
MSNEIFTAAKNYVLVFLFVTQRSDVISYLHFRGTLCSQLHHFCHEEDNEFAQDVDNHPRYYTAL